MSAVAVDLFDVRRALGAAGVLRAFNDAGVLSAADVHVATRLAALAGEDDETLTLGAALAVRAPRLGHVFVDLATIRETATVDAEEPVDLSGLPWPEPTAWIAGLAASDLTAGPLHLDGSALYLDRYWREEVQIAEDLRLLAADPASGAIDHGVLRDGVARLFPDPDDDRQALAAAAAVLRRFAVVAGGPGTGKTTTVARIVALLAEQSATPLLVALAAPTGKAAARLEESVHEEARKLDVGDAVRAQLLDLTASTLHRLLGWRPDSHSRFRHDRGNRLPHDIVIVDETSMVSLSLMARLVEAVRPDARLVLVGDPGQLTSIEAGAVLGDIVGPAAAGLRIGAATRTALEAATGRPVDALDPGDGGAGAVGDGIVVLTRTHRFGTAIGAVADAVRRGDAGGALTALTAAPEEITWVDADAAEPVAAGAAALAALREHVVASARSVTDAAAAGDARGALEALAAFRLLCAHRRGPYGVDTWTARIEGWLADAMPGFAAEGAWYPGRPLLVTENDYGVGLFNGDTGVVVTAAGRASAAFERRGEIARFSPARLSAVETVYAMTIHKSQGSQFGTAAVLLPDPSSQLLTRELLYTAVTRARRRLLLIAPADAVRAAVERPVARASGLGRRLWK